MDTLGSDSKATTRQVKKVRLGILSPEEIRKNGRRPVINLSRKPCHGPFQRVNTDL